MIDISVAEVMSRSVRTVTEETTASGVATLFAENGIGSAVVVDGTGDPVGIVTESDVMRQVAAGADVTAVPVGSFMTAPIVTVDSAQTIHAAATLMRDHAIRRLPVVDASDLVGIVTTTNLVHYIPRLRTGIARDRTELAGQ